MLQNLRQTNITQTFVLKPYIFMKDKEFHKCFNIVFYFNILINLLGSCKVLKLCCMFEKYLGCLTEKLKQV